MLCRQGISLAKKITCEVVKVLLFSSSLVIAHAALLGRVIPPSPFPTQTGEVPMEVPVSVRFWFSELVGFVWLLLHDPVDLGAAPGGGL